MKKILNRAVPDSNRDGLSLLVPTAQPTPTQTCRSIPTAKNKIPLLLVFCSLFLFPSCTNVNTEGDRLYKAHCLQCHQEGGKGVGKFIPPIDKEFMLENTARLGCIIKYGMNENINIKGTNYWDHMPGNNKLTDFDIVNLLNYINENYGTGDKEKFNIEELRNNLKNCNKKPYYPTE